MALCDPNRWVPDRSGQSPDRHNLQVRNARAGRRVLTFGYQVSGSGHWRNCRRRRYSAGLMTTELSFAATFQCPHCEALYEVRYTYVPTRDSESAYCVVCRQRMSRWNSTAQPTYTLIERSPQK